MSTHRSADGEDVSVGLVAPAYVCVPLWIAQRRGSFERVGIRATAQICGTTDGTTEAARAGAVQFALTAPEGAIVDAMTGGQLLLIAGLANRPPLSLIAQARYRSIEDLRHARIGTSSLTEGTRHIVEEMLRAHGLVHERDYEFVLAGAHPQRWEALRSGTIDAAQHRAAPATVHQIAAAAAANIQQARAIQVIRQLRQHRTLFCAHERIVGIWRIVGRPQCVPGDRIKFTRVIHCTDSPGSKVHGITVSGSKASVRHSFG